MASEIDREVRRLVESAYRRARDILLANRAALDEIARRLLIEETIEGEEFEEIFRNLPQPVLEPVPV